MDDDAVVPQFSQALEAIHEHSGIAFKKCVIQVDSLVNESGEFLPASNEMFSLRFLDPLRPSNDDDDEALPDFLPGTLYIRSEMQTMFPKFVQSFDRGEAKRILVGSPGVGKSVLFFLAALGRARFQRNKIVLYVRKVSEELSLFVMERSNKTDGTINVLCCRDMDQRVFSNLTELSLKITARTSLRKFFIMLDGPRHDGDKKEDLMSNCYNALCTGDGFPVPSQQDIIAVTVLVLSGWTETAILGALNKMKVCGADADEVYALCGGRIRLVVWAITNQRQKVKSWFNSQVTASLGDGSTVELAMQSQGSAGTIDSILRTRFFADDVNVMVVDSQYLFQKLTERVHPDALIEAYNLAQASKLDSTQGWIYEEILHRWFQGKAEEGSFHKIARFVRTRGISGAASVEELVDLCVEGRGERVYWAPSSFANNIGAAIMMGSVLNCVRATVRPTVPFDKSTFWTNLVGQLVQGGVVLTEVRVWFVTPPNVEFDMNMHENYTPKYALPAAAQTRNKPKYSLAGTVLAQTRRMGLGEMPVSFHVHKVEASSVVALHQSASAIPFLLDA